MPAALTVVTVNYRRPQDTVACLASVAPQVGDGSRLLVVDNGSGDGSEAFIRRHCPDVEVIALPRNVGFSEGYNAGIARALETGAESCLLLNNDTLAGPSAIAALVAALDRWDVVVPKIQFASDPARIWAAGAYWRRFPPSVVMRGYGRPDGPPYSAPGRLDYATGCALLVKRQVLERVGGFDPLYVNYWEDYDFCYRVRAAGFQLGYVPSAVILHKVSQTLGESSPAKWRHLGRNMVLFYRRRNRFSPVTLWTYMSWVMLRELLKGQPQGLPDFWRGMHEGFAVLEQGL